MSREDAKVESQEIVAGALSESAAGLLGELAALLRRFVVMTSSQARIVALWVIHTYVLDGADATPYLAITSAEKRSGKTRLLEVLELLVLRAWLTGRTTAAVLPRKIDADQPTLLLDESDAAFGGDKEYAEALRGVLNSGHRRGGKTTVCVGQGANIGFKDFSVFSPKAIAGIGKLPDTVADRAIPIRLQRRGPGEAVDRFRRREVEPQTQQLRYRLDAFAEVAVEVLKQAQPDLPDELDDRAWDGLEPLLGIADLAGGDWPVFARAAAVELYGGRALEDDSTGIRLLADIRGVLEPDGKPLKQIPTADLLAALNELDEAPWGDWFGKPLTSRVLARLLKPYDIHSKDIWVAQGIEKKSRKGFERDQFDGAFSRYLASYPREGENPYSRAENSQSESARAGGLSRIENSRNPSPDAGSRGLADRDPDMGSAGACAAHRGDPRPGCSYCQSAAES